MIINKNLRILDLNITLIFTAIMKLQLMLLNFILSIRIKLRN